MHSWLSVTSWIIFSCLLLALQVKVGKVASFSWIKYLCMVRVPTTKTNYFPEITSLNIRYLSEVNIRFVGFKGQCIN